MIDYVQPLLQIGVGVTMVAFGITQLIKPSGWKGYIPKLAKLILPKSLENGFMRIHGFCNFGLGLLFAFGIGGVVMAWVTAAWWLVILPFAFMYDWRDGLRDFTIIMAIITVALAMS